MINFSRLFFILGIKILTTGYNSCKITTKGQRKSNFIKGAKMSKISDIIETFILEQLEQAEFIDLSRNELASFFNCAPSQINYVLSTRFTEPKGFLIESYRGGGGYIRLARINIDRSEYINHLICDTLTREIDYKEGLSIISKLCELELIDSSSAMILGYAISPKSLALPIRIENKQRANILKNVLINLLKENGDV